MSDKSAIEWTDATWNPVTGCTKVSPGCDNCYAERFAERWRGIKGHPFEQGFDVKLHPDRLEIPYKWKRPRRIFVNSMSDLFHREVPDEFIDRVFSVMAINSRHTFQVLTKRAERLRRWAQREDALALIDDHATCAWMAAVPPDAVYPLPNVWLGCSVESAAYRWRVDMLRETPAAVRFLSIEPLIGDVGELNLDGIDWVIVGGESGPRSRPMHQQWALHVLEQCEAAGVSFFFKQWGEYKPLGTLNGIIPLTLDKSRAVVFRDGTMATKETLHSIDFDAYKGARAELVERVGKKKAGRTLAGREWNEFPERAIV